MIEKGVVGLSTHTSHELVCTARFNTIYRKSYPYATHAKMQSDSCGDNHRGCFWELIVQVTVTFFFVFSDITHFFFFFDSNCNSLLKSNAAISHEEKHCF